MKLLEIKEFKATPGIGVKDLVNGNTIMIVGSNYLKEMNISIENEKVNEVLKQGKTVVYVMLNGNPMGAIALADMIRDKSKEAIKSLKELGIKTIMLTGDNKLVASWVAKELGIDEFYAEVLPHEKAEVIRKVKSNGYIVAMVGDGINDAPALVEADVGVAIGAGTDIAIESADIILVKNDPRDIPKIISLAKRTYKKVLQNLLWATGYNIIAIPLAAGVLYGIGLLLPPAVGALLMSLSTVIVAINASSLK